MIFLIQPSWNNGTSNKMWHQLCCCCWFLFHSKLHNTTLVLHLTVTMVGQTKYKNWDSTDCRVQLVRPPVPHNRYCSSNLRCKADGA